MQLPRFQGDSDIFNMMQTKWASILNPLLANPLIQGQLLQDVPLINGTVEVSHGLGRKLVGWIIVGINASATVYDNQASNRIPDLTLSLTSNAVATAQLYVF